MTRRALCCCTAAVLAALGIPAGHAHAATAATAAATSAAGPSCSDGNLSTADLSGSATSVKAGAAIVDSERLTNATAATLSNTSFIMALVPPSDNGGSGTPQLSWRVDGGAWHAFGLKWVAPSGSGADWQSQVQYVGATFAPKASHTLDIRTVFSTASPSGEYIYNLDYSADPCGMQELGMSLEYSQYAQGWTQTHPQPSPTPHKTTAPAVPTHTPARTSTSTAHSPAPATTSPRPSSASLSPSPTGTPSVAPTTADAATPSTAAQTTTALAAQPTAAARPNRTPTVLAITLAAFAALLLLGGGLYVGRRSRRAAAGSADSTDSTDE